MSIMMRNITVTFEKAAKTKYDANNIDQNKAELSKRGLLVGGASGELIERLLADDRRNAALAPRPTYNQLNDPDGAKRKAEADKAKNDANNALNDTLTRQEKSLSRELSRKRTKATAALKEVRTTYDRKVIDINRNELTERPVKDEEKSEALREYRERNKLISDHLKMQEDALIEQATKAKSINTVEKKKNFDIHKQAFVSIEEAVTKKKQAAMKNKKTGPKEKDIGDKVNGAPSKGASSKDTLTKDVPSKDASFKDASSKDVPSKDVPSTDASSKEKNDVSGAAKQQPKRLRSLEGVEFGGYISDDDDDVGEAGRASKKPCYEKVKSY